MAPLLLLLVAGEREKAPLVVVVVVVVGHQSVVVRSASKPMIWPQAAPAARAVSDGRAYRWRHRCMPALRSLKRKAALGSPPCPIATATPRRPIHPLKPTIHILSGTPPQAPCQSTLTSQAAATKAPAPTTVAPAVASMTATTTDLLVCAAVALHLATAPPMKPPQSRAPTLTRTAAAAARAEGTNHGGANRRTRVMVTATPPSTTPRMAHMRTSVSCQMR